MASKDKNKKRGLAPWVGSEPRILILGSLPGDESIAQQAYYQNPRNPFYKIMHTLFPGGEQYDDKEFVLSHHIALWDMLKSADREGSSDKNIKNEIPNDIQGFLNKYTLSILSSSTEREKTTTDTSTGTSQMFTIITTSYFFPKRLLTFRLRTNLRLGR